MTPTLPVEILEQIVSYLDTEELKKIRAASKQLESLGTPRLFGSITIRASEQDLTYPGIENALASSLHGPRDLLHLARKITFSAKFRHRYWRRCPHFASSHNPQGTPRNEAEDGNEPDGDDDKLTTSSEYPDDDLLDEDDLTDDQRQDVRRLMHWQYDCENPPGITRLKNRVMALLIRCKEGSLKEFNWDMGICCPHPALGSTGLLARRQNNIESIRIINDYQCSGHDYWLSDFPKLKRLSWIGLTWIDDFSALQDGLSKVSHQLTLLELDFFPWENRIPRSNQYSPWYFKNEDEANSPNYFAWIILGLSINQKKRVLPSLEKLSLCAVPLDLAERELAYAFDWSRLQSLNLRFCPGWNGFLKQVVASGQPIKLKSLSLEPSEFIEFPDDGVSTICYFLRAFAGLEDLFISTNEASGTLEIWTAAVNHKATLRRFVHNQCGMEIDLDTVEPPLDPPSLPFSPEELETMVRTPSVNPLTSLDLEFLGLSYDPARCKALLSAFVNKKTLKVLHIRQAGCYPDVYHNWTTDDPGNEKRVRFIKGDYYFTCEYPVQRNPSKSLQELRDWIFGSAGISSLELLACGDFSYDARYKDTIWLEFRTAGASPLRKKHSDALQACPHENLFARHS